MNFYLIFKVPTLMFFLLESPLPWPASLLTTPLNFHELQAVPFCSYTSEPVYMLFPQSKMPSPCTLAKLLSTRQSPLSKPRTLCEWRVEQQRSTHQIVEGISQLFDHL